MLWATKTGSALVDPLGVPSKKSTAAQSDGFAPAGAIVFMAWSVQPAASCGMNPTPSTTAGPTADGLRRGPFQMLLMG